MRGYVLGLEIKKYGFITLQINIKRYPNRVNTLYGISKLIWWYS